MKYYVFCVGYDSDYEIVVCNSLQEAKDMCSNSCGIAIFDKKPVYCHPSCSLEVL